MDPERVRWWHGAIFVRHFPHEGGRFRRDRAFFGVTVPNGGMRQLEGAAPKAILGELQQSARRSTGTQTRSVTRTPRVSSTGRGLWLLSQGARRAIEMKQEARQAAAPVTPGTASQAA